MSNHLGSNYLFTSESVSEGHPDKVSDQISDAILDAILEQDPTARVAAETLCNTGLVVLAGEITTNAVIDYIDIARNTLKHIGYDDTDYGPNADGITDYDDWGDEDGWDDTDYDDRDDNDDWDDDWDD